MSWGPWGDLLCQGVIFGGSQNALECQQATAPPRVAGGCLPGQAQQGSQLVKFSLPRLWGQQRLPSLKVFGHASLGRRSQYSPKVAMLNPPPVTLVLDLNSSISLADLPKQTGSFSYFKSQRKLGHSGICPNLKAETTAHEVPFPLRHRSAGTHTPPQLYGTHSVDKNFLASEPDAPFLAHSCVSKKVTSMLDVRRGKQQTVSTEIFLKKHVPGRPTGICERFSAI